MAAKPEPGSEPDSEPDFLVLRSVRDTHAELSILFLS